MSMIYQCDRCKDILRPDNSPYQIIYLDCTVGATGRKVYLCTQCCDVLQRICDAFMQEDERYRRPGRHEFLASVKDLLSGTRYDVDKPKDDVRAYADRFKGSNDTGC